MAPIIFPAGCMFLLSLIPIVFTVSSLDKKLCVVGIFIIVPGLAGFLNRETRWPVKSGSALMIVAAWYAAGCLESTYTAFFPPRELIVYATGIIMLFSLLGVFGAAKLFRLIIRPNR